MNKIKVNFHITTMFFGGIEKILLTYLNNFDRCIFDVSLSISYYMGKELEVLIPYVPSDVKINYIVKPRFLNNVKIKKKQKVNYTYLERCIDNLIFKHITRAWHFVKFYYMSQHYDIVINFDLCPFLTRSLSPVIGVLHFNLASQTTTKRDKANVYKQFSLSSAIVLISQDMKDECLVNYPKFADKFYVVFNPFDIAKIREMALKPFNNVFGNYIVSVCRLEESQKDVTSLIKAFDILIHQYGYSGNLVLVGDGTSRIQLESLVLRLNLSSHVFFEGIQQNPFNYMQNAKMCVLSSKYEGLPSVVIEALIVGVPVIASNCPTGSREILQDGEFGALFEVGNYIQLANIMYSLLMNYSLQHELIQKSIRRANDFGLKAALNSFYSMIDEIVHGK